jgi:hypothetical protein
MRDRSAPGAGKAPRINYWTVMVTTVEAVALGLLVSAAFTVNV